MRCLIVGNLVFQGGRRLFRFLHAATDTGRASRSCGLATALSRGGTLALLLWCFPAVAGNVAPAGKTCAPRISGVRPVPVAAADEITVATQNLRRLFDDVDDGRGELATTARYQQRLDRLSRHIVQVLHSPDVLAVQEVETIKVLQDLAAAIAAQGGKTYQAILLEGHDWGGIDVGFLVRSDMRTVGQQQVLKMRRLDRAALFDRPPLWLRLQMAEGRVLNIVNVHLKSLRGSDDPAVAKKIARKRQRQAEALAEWVGLYLARPAAEPLLVLGDFNASFTVLSDAASDVDAEALGAVDVMGIIQAEGLSNQWPRLPAGERYSYVHACRPEALDHVLVSTALLPAVRALAVSRGNAGARRRADDADNSALRSSDHDALVLYLKP